MRKIWLLVLIWRVSGGKVNDYVSLIREDFQKIPFLLLNVSSECKRDLYEYYRGVKEKSGWAVAMLDSMEKFPSGLLLGRRMALGQFDECVAATHSNFTGQHCMVEVAVKKNSSNAALSHTPNFPERLMHGQFSYGVCVPSTCSASDLKTVVESFGLGHVLKFEVEDGSCNTGRFPELRLKDLIAIGFFLFVVSVSFLSTACDVYCTFVRSTKIGRVWTSFSLYSNFKLLFQINDSFPEMNSIYGIRFLSMAWVVLGHLFTSLVYGYEINNLDKMSILSNKTAIFATNAYVCVDSFFFLSGLLVCFVFFRDISKKGGFDAPLAFVHRYLRLTPTLAVMILFHFTIFSRISIAPYWKPVFQEMESSCRDYWWTFFLYVQNYYYPNAKKCFSAAWYLCADTHMFLISPFILYFLLLRPKAAPLFLMALVTTSSLISFFTCYKDDLPPNRSADSIRLFNPKHFVNEYVLFHTRMTPWAVGVATGYVICGIRAKKISFPPKKVWVVIGWLMSAFLCLSSLYGIAAFFPYNAHHSTLAKSSYRAFHRLGWALGLSWVVIACVSGCGGPVNTFLSLKVFQPLAKLSYCTFLIHLSVQLYRHFNESRSLKYFDFFSLTYTYLGDLIVSIVLSIPLWLFIEMPFSHLEKIFLEKVKIFPYPKSGKIDNSNYNQKNVCDQESREKKSQV